MDAKRIAKTHEEYDAMPLDEWLAVRDDAMRYALAVKLEQHPDTFGEALLATGSRPIVEESRWDDYWGAKRHTSGLVGTNRLGCLLTDLREILIRHNDHTMAARSLTEQITTPALTINGRPALARMECEWRRLRSEAVEGDNAK